MSAYRLKGPDAPTLPPPLDVWEAYLDASENVRLKRYLAKFSKAPTTPRARATHFLNQAAACRIAAVREDELGYARWLGWAQSAIRKVQPVRSGGR